MEMKKWLETAEDIIVIGRVGEQIDVRTQVDTELAIEYLETVLTMLYAVAEGDVELVDKFH